MLTFLDDSRYDRFSHASRTYSWNAASPADIVATCAVPLAGFKRGRQIFTHLLPTLHRPH
jgi:hypothetical protein